MKAGLVAAVEAMRVIRQTGVARSGNILFTAHDLHEAPWGLGQQLDQLIADGIVGDAVLIPESHCSVIHVVGRGAATWKVRLRRKGEPVHEVMRSVTEPSVIAAAADLVRDLEALQRRLNGVNDPGGAGSESVFVGQIHAGEIYNQYPQECWLEGTRRWLPDTDPATVEAGLNEILKGIARRRGVTVELEYKKVRGAFKLDPKNPLVGTFQQAHRLVSGTELPFGPKAFVDDGNSFWALADRPAITHGPKAGGQHTVDEWVSIDDLVRVARVYAATAAVYLAK
jgi:acetylornithine deacetylase/succinyl-diaminopimelate desuccinylase-like protein